MTLGKVNVLISYPFFFLKLFDSSRKELNLSLLEATGWGKPPCIRCYSLKFVLKKLSLGKLQNHKNFTHNSIEE